MDIPRLVEALGRTESYPHAAERIEIRQTHISVVALAGNYAYKIKKPLSLGFLDFTTLDRRLHYCREEVRLNQRLAPDVYLGVVPIVASPEGLTVGGDGAPDEYAVKMRRLPDEATLLRRLERREPLGDVLAALGRRVAAFHATAESGPEIDRYGQWDVVGRNARENLEQSRTHVGTCLSRTVFTRLHEALERRLHSHRTTMEDRARAHVPRDTHGDLHLDHVYLFPDREPPRDLVVIDCIEFNERFRYADPVSDMAFLVMDLLAHGRWDLAARFADAYFHVADDAHGRALLAFYVAYRAAVRGKVEGMAAQEGEVPRSHRQEAIRKARGHWLLALSELERPDRRPGLVLVGGLPGTGKTTLAEAVARTVGFRVISSDRVRKELAGMSPEAPAPATFGEGIYTAAWNERTYAECLRRAEALVFEGQRVIVDASFRERAQRRAFLDAADGWGVRSLLLVCTADASVVHARISAPRAGGSDADWAIHRAAAQVWEREDLDDPRRRSRVVATDGALDAAVAAALEQLRGVGLTP